MNMQDEVFQSADTDERYAHLTERYAGHPLLMNYWLYINSICVWSGGSTKLPASEI